MQRYFYPSLLVLLIFSLVALGPIAPVGASGQLAPAAQVENPGTRIYLPSLLARSLAAPMACQEILANGGMEANANWVFPLTQSQASYSTTDRHAGSRSARVGLLPNAALTEVGSQAGPEVSLTGQVAPEGATFSSMYQVVTVPASAAVATLSFWYNAGTDDTTGDVLQALILDGNTLQLLNELTRTFNTDRRWHQTSFDLSAYRGRSIAVAFEVLNDETVNARRTWMFVDDVSVQACDSAVVTPTPTPTTTVPTATTAPGTCTNLLLNGDMEANTGWVFPLTQSQGRYSTASFHAGTRSAQLGLLPGQALAQVSAQGEERLDGQSAPASATYSSMYQVITVPAAATSASFSFWYRAGSADASGDVLQALIREGDSLQLLNELTRTFNTDQQWHQVTFDLSAFRGRKIAVGFEVLNDETIDFGRTWMFVDDVVVNSCAGAVLTPTATSPAATVTPIPAGCTNLLQNSDMEANAAWVFPLTQSQGGYSTAAFHAGARSARLGLLPGQALAQVSAQAGPEVSLTGQLAPAGATYSSMYQVITVPAAATSASLSFWYNAGTEDVSGDVLQALIREGSSLQLLNELTRTFNTDRQWHQVTFDLSAYRGRSIAIGFEVLNDETINAGRTWMYIDDVVVNSCAGAPTPTMTPTVVVTGTVPTPTATGTVVPACQNILLNSGMETNTNWVFPFTASEGGYSTAAFHTGTRSARLGLLPGQTLLQLSAQGEERLDGQSAPAAATYSSMYQVVTVPAAAARATLTFWYNARSNDAAGDVQQALIREGDSLALLSELTRTFVNDGTWRSMTFDVSAFRGRKIAVSFEVLNDETIDAGRTWMYIDDVVIETCSS